MATPVTANDVFELLSSRGAASAVEAFNVTNDASTNDPNGPFRALWIGAAGSVNVLTLGGQSVTFVGCTAGSIIPIAVKRVGTAGQGTTVASIDTNIIGLR